MLSSLLLGLFTECNKTKNVTQKYESTNQTESFDFRTDKKFQETFNSEEIKNSENIAAKQYSVDMQKINAVYALTPSSVRRQAFNLLNDEEQYVFWDNLTDIKIANSSLNNNQKLLLNVFEELVVRRIFFKPQGENIRNVFNALSPQIITQFNNSGISNEVLYNIFYSGKFAPFNPQPDDVIIGGPIRSCGCNTSSLFNGGNGCNSQCATSSYGCGFLWAFSCNGRSYFINIFGDPRYYDDF